jgi:hypothetical protein
MELQRQKQFLGLLEKELVIAMGAQNRSGRFGGAKAANCLAHALNS